MKIDVDKLICDFLSYEHKIDKDSPFKELNRAEASIVAAAGCYIGMALKNALKEQYLVYKDGKITPLSDIHIFEELPKEEQLKWYKCIEPIIVPELKMPLFCEDEVAPLEKIFAYCPKLKNDAELFAKYFRKVVEADLMDTESRKVEEAITNEPASDSIWPKEIIKELERETAESTRELEKQMKKIVFAVEPDFVAMADKYYNEVLLGECKYPEPLAGHYRLCYYQGLKDMYNKMKK